VCGPVHAAARVGYTSIDLSTKFLRQVTIASGRLHCEGTLISAGRRTALAEAKLRDGRGRLLAHGTSTCMVFDISEYAQS
jgi:acyl-coenzyme A thioesterase PaaI-like protein